MPANIEELTETQSSIDTDAALADISSDLFGQGSSEGPDGGNATEGEKTGTTSEPSADASQASPQTTAEVKTPEEGDNSAAVQETGAPKTWTKEALAEWSTVPPRVQQEILKREQDFLNGITQYKSGAELGQKYDAVVEPFRPLLTAENIDPVQLFQSFASNHYLLSRGTPEQKLQLAANLISGYNIDFGQLISFMGNQVNEPVDPRVAALEKEIADLKGYRNQQEQAQVQQVQQTVEQEIAAFAADPANIYFDELAADIAKLFEAGLVTDLKDAYEKAVFANPVTRQKEIDRLTATRQTSAEAAEKARKDKIARTTAADVTTQQTSRNGTVPVGSMDDTLAETLRNITSRG